MNPWELPKDTKNFFVKGSVNRSLPGTQKQLCSELPFREICGREIVDGKPSGYRSPTGDFSIYFNVDFWRLAFFPPFWKLFKKYRQ